MYISKKIYEALSVYVISKYVYKYVRKFVSKQVIKNVCK